MFCLHCGNCAQMPAFTRSMQTEIVDGTRKKETDDDRKSGFQNVHYLDLRGTLSNNLSDDEDWWGERTSPHRRDRIGRRKDGFAARFQQALAQLP